MKTILCFGDSNTHGSRAMRFAGDFRRHGDNARWPSRMADALGDGYRVIEEGHPGRTTWHDDPVEGVHKNGGRLLPALLESHRPIDLVIIMLGTNDLKARFSLNAADIAQSAENLVQLVGRSNSGPDRNAPQVMLVAPVPIREIGFLGEIFAGGEAKSRRLSAALSAVAQREGVVFFDAGAVARVDPVDGVHLDAKSHAAIADAITERVARIFSSDPVQNDA